METIRFIVQGSADEPYVTTFVKRSTFSLSAYCTCPAGQSGLYCKHRFMILEGVDPGIVSNNNHEISLVVNWLAGTDVEQAINLMKELEDDLADIKARVKRAKAHVAQVMRGAVMKELALLKSLWSERVSRSVELIVPIKTSSSGSYIDSGHWAYDVPFGFRVALDLSYDRRIKNRIPYYVWTQGPLLNFKLGDVLHSHDGSKCVQVEFAIAMQWNAEKQKMDTGFVEFAHYLIIDGAYRLEKKEILDQMEFLKMLITGC